CAPGQRLAPAAASISAELASRLTPCALCWCVARCFATALLHQRWTNRKEHITFRRNLPVHRYTRVSLANAATNSRQRHLNHQGIARHYLTFKAPAIQTCQEGQAPLVFRLTEHSHRTHLGSRFSNQHAWHHRILRKMSLKKRFVARNLL